MGEYSSCKRHSKEIGPKDVETSLKFVRSPTQLKEALELNDEEGQRQATF